MRSFLNKYYPPWSLPWILQRTWMKLMDFRASRTSFHTLWTDYKLTRKISKSHRKSAQENGQVIIEPQTRPQEPGSIHTPRMVFDPLPEINLSSVNTYFDHVYIVNLERREDRRVKMIRKLSGLNIQAEFFPAVDGFSDQNIKEFKAYLHSPIDPSTAHEKEWKLRRKVIYSPGAWGTLKTYHRLINDAKERGFRKILSLEDDIAFAKDFESLFSQAIDLLPTAWKLLYLGASQHSWVEGKDLLTPANTPYKNGPIEYYHPLQADGAFAIGIDHSAYDMLLLEIERMNCPFDSGAMQLITKIYPDECYVLKPNLVIADVSESENTIRRKMGAFAKTVRWDLGLYDLA